MAKLAERQQDVFEASSQQLGAIGGAMKEDTTKHAFGVKLFPIFFCGCCILLLGVLVMNGTLPKAPMLLLAPCVMVAVGCYIWKVTFRQPIAVGGAMKKISNPYTFANKLLPFLFCGGCAFLLVLLMMNGALLKTPMFLVFPCVMAVAGYYLWKANMQDLMDEVYDCGDYLLVKKRGEEDTVLLSNINYVDFSTAHDGANARITLRLDAPGKFGTEISFAPPPNISFPRRNEIAEDLLARVDKARSEREV